MNNINNLISQLTEQQINSLLIEYYNTPNDLVELQKNANLEVKKFELFNLVNIGEIDSILLIIEIYS